MVKDEAEHLCKLFIGGLDYRTTDESLKGHFEQFGEIVDVIVMKDPQTKRSRGFGFVAFSQSYMVDEAQKNRPHVIDGRTVDTKRAIPRDEIGKAESAGQTKKLFVGGIKDVGEEEIREAFNQYGEVVSVSIPVERETQKKRGFAFVEFSDADAADKAALHREVMIGDTRVDVKKARDKNDMGAGGRGGRGGGRGGYGGRDGGYNQGGNSWGGNQGGYGSQGGYGGRQGGQGGYGGGYGSGGYGGSSGGYGGSSGGGYGSQGSWGGQSSGGYGDSSSQGGWGSSGQDFGSSYGQGYSGGPTRGQGSYGQSQRSAPYGGGQGGYGMGGSGGGYGSGGYSSGKRY